jgi:signal transduction histidine kinase
MRPTGYVSLWREMGGSRAAPPGPAMATLRSVIAQLASLVRTASIVYVIVQVAIWHSFYAASPVRLAGPALAVAWASAVTARLRRRWPSVLLVGADSAFYVALALGAQQCVPPGIRDDAFSWLVISLSGQLIVPAWYAPGALSLPLALLPPAAYWIGAMPQQATDLKALTGSALLLCAIALAHGLGRRELYRRAETADAALGEADRAASEQYAILSRNIERREHERLLHDTVLNTLTAIARAAPDDPDNLAGVLDRCRRDVALIEDVLADPADPAAGGRGPGDPLGEVRAVIADMRDRGLSIHVDIDDEGAPAVPARVTAAIANAAREALANVAAHAGTGEAWVRVHLTPPAAGAGSPGRLQVVVRDRGAGFDLARVDQARLGLRRSIAERTADCGGQASIWSAPGQGAVFSMSWPAPARAGEPEPAGRW